MRQTVVLKKQLGLTLVELMVAMLVGLLLMAGILKVFSSNQQTYRVTENLSRVQENGRYAIDILTRSVRKAGHAGNNENSHKVSFLAAPTLLASPGPANFSTDGIIAGNNNEFSIRYIAGDKTNITDCLGNPVSAGTEVTNRFYLDTANNELECSSTLGGAQPLVDNVEDMQILYGLSTDPTLLSGLGHNVQVDCYLPAEQPVGTTNVTASSVTNCTSGLNFRQVVSIRIHLLISTPDDNVTPANQNQSYLYNSSPATLAPDNRLYREFSTSIALRNRVL